MPFQKPSIVYLRSKVNAEVIISDVLNSEGYKKCLIDDRVIVSMIAYLERWISTIPSKCPPWSKNSK